MTRQKSFKRLVRARMAKTGESYTAARTTILAATPDPVGQEEPVLVVSDEKVRSRTGRSWEDWFDLIDSWGAGELTHREIARKVAAELGIDPLAWNAQAVTTSYERARGRRVVGQRTDGFAATASKTVGVGVEELYSAFMEAGGRRTWLADDRLRVRSGTPLRTAHFDWGDDGSRVHVTFAAKDDGRAVVSLEHARLPDADTADVFKKLWRDSLSRLASQLEGGEGDA